LGAQSFQTSCSGEELAYFDHLKLNFNSFTEVRKEEKKVALTHIDKNSTPLPVSLAQFTCYGAACKVH
jgi:hypothetical protein